MAESPSHPATRADQSPLDVLPGFWDEYRYRHDMIWSLIFQVTAVAGLPRPEGFHVAFRPGAEAPRGVGSGTMRPSILS